MNANDTVAPTQDSERAYWREIRASGKITWVILALAMVGTIVHQLGPLFKWTNGWPSFNKFNLWEWYIEDAAISFTYAKNLAEGNGLVVFPGGERVEGYSNPTWVGLMALWELIGIDGFSSAKIMALFFGCATVPLVWLIAREIAVDKNSPATLLAPMFLAVFPQFAFWNAAGLENPIVNFCLAGGFWRILVEARLGGAPWSAVWLLFLATSRPEAIMYSAWGGFLAMIFALTQGRGLRSTVQWLVIFFVPFTIYHAIRYEYFAWAFPNTYYAKLGDKEFKPFAWSSRGWKYIRGFSSGDFTATGNQGTGLGWFMPVYFAAIVGLRGVRAWLVPIATVLTLLGVFYPKTDLVTGLTWWPKDLPEPSWWAEARVWLLFSVALGLPVAGIRDHSSRGRILLWGSALITLFFCVLANGDWMKGYRWMSFVSVPAACLFAAGVEELALASERWFAKSEGLTWGTTAWTVAPLLAVGILPNFYLHSEWFFGKRETGPASVQKRVEYTASLTKKLFLNDQLIHNLDVDMGAHTVWSKHLMVDMAGLLDVSVAHHTYAQRPFVKEYLFQETKAEIAHVHGGWASSSHIPTYAEWKAGYFEAPPFPAGGSSYHVGTHVRRDLVMQTDWAGGAGRAVEFEDGLKLRGFNIPSAEVSVNKSFYLEIGVQYDKKDDRRPFRVLGFLSRASADPATPAVVSVFDLPPAYDWLPVDEWHPNEVFFGKFTPTLEKQIEAGDWDLGFVFFAEDGRVLQPTAAPAGAVIGGRDNEPARVAAGEVRFAAALKVGEPGTGEKAARDDFEKAIALAKSTDCKKSEAAWRLSRLHMPKADKWYEENRAEFAPVIAQCWVDLARETDSDEEASFLMVTARFWDFQNADLWELATELGERQYDAGMEARAAGDWEAAYKAFATAVRADTRLSWARRYAEEARDHRLKLDPESVQKAADDREARIQTMKDQQGGGEAPAEGEAAEKPKAVLRKPVPGPKASPDADGVEPAAEPAAAPAAAP